MRVSKHFLLSDFMGCHSVYAHGYRNLFDDPDGTKFTEIVCLAESVLEPIVAQSPLSVTYGYISLDLARKIVKYQDPNKPSYHQWNDGAAVDIIVHDPVNQGIAPIYVAFMVDDLLPTSRVITYSESPAICVATRMREVEAGKPRKALYENRYIGKVKPQYISYPMTAATREAMKEAHQLEHPWQGAGYPTYHGGGRRQMHHVRTSEYTVLSDFLFSEHAVTEGLKNVPTSLAGGTLDRFRHAGAVYDSLLHEAHVNRLSIVRAFESPVWSTNPDRNWRYSWAIDVVPPEGFSLDDLEYAARSVGQKATVSTSGYLTVYGEF